MRPGPAPAIARVSRDGTVQNSTPFAHDQRLPDRCADPEPGKAARTIGNDDRQDRLARHARAREQPVDRRQQRRRMLARALHFLVHRAGGRRPSATDSRLGRGVDREAHQPTSTPRTPGSSRCDSRQRARWPPVPILRPAPATRSAARPRRQQGPPSPGRRPPPAAAAGSSRGGTPDPGARHSDAPGRRSGSTRPPRRRARARWPAPRSSCPRRDRPQVHDRAGSERPADPFALRGEFAPR